MNYMNYVVYLCTQFVLSFSVFSLYTRLVLQVKLHCPLAHLINIYLKEEIIHSNILYFIKLIIQMVFAETITLCVILFVLAAFLVWYYVRKDTPIYVSALSFVGWFLGFAIIGILPFDIYLVYNISSYCI